MLIMIREALISQNIIRRQYDDFLFGISNKLTRFASTVLILLLNKYEILLMLLVASLLFIIYLDLPQGTKNNPTGRRTHDRQVW